MIKYNNPLADFIASLRTRGIFDGVNPGGAIPNQGVNPQSPYQPQSPVGSMLDPNYMALQDFNEMVGGMPRREDYNPSIMQRIGAAVTGIGSGRPAGMWGGNPTGWISNPQAGRDAIERPYNNAVDDWKLETDAKFRSATLEGAVNRDQSMERNRLEDNAANQRRLDITEQRNADLRTAEENRQKMAQLKLDFDRMKLENPELKMIAPRGGNFTLYNPRTGEMHDTGTPVGNSTDVDRIRMGAEAAESLEDYRQKNRVSLENIRSQNTLGEIDARGDQARRTQAERPASASAGQSESQEFRGNQNDIIKIVRDNPRFKTHFEYTTSGQPTGFMKDRPEGNDPEGPTKEQEDWDEARRLLQSSSQIGDISLGGSRPRSATTADPLRAQAIQILTEGKKPVTEANINAVIEQLK